MFGLYNLAIDVKHVDLFACEVEMGIGCGLLILEVETHFHEAIVEFSGVEVDVEGVLDGLVFDEGLTGLGLVFGQDLAVMVGSGQEPKHRFVIINSEQY